MEDIFTEQDSSLSKALDIIRLGNVESGLQLLDMAEGEEVLKNLAKAEIAYWRHDWKNAMYLEEHSLSHDDLWTDSFVMPHHLRAYVYAAKQIGAESRAHCFLEFLTDKKRKELDASAVKPYLKMFRNAARRLDDEKADDTPADIRIIEGDESTCQIQMFSMQGPISPSREAELPISLLLEMTFNKAPTKVVLDLYERYAEYISRDQHHITAARTYLKLGDTEKADTCLARVFDVWHPSENFQVMPMKLFVYDDLMEHIFGCGYQDKYLALPKASPKSPADILKELLNIASPSQEE